MINSVQLIRMIRKVNPGPGSEIKVQMRLTWTLKRKKKGIKGRRRVKTMNQTQRQKSLEQKWQLV